MNNDFQEIKYEDDNDWKVKTIIIGGILGALSGVGAGYLMVKRAEQTGEKFSMSSGKGLKLGVLLAGLMRSLLNLNED